MELFIYDNARKLLGVVESYEYLRWTRRYSECGDFELRATASADNVAFLRLGNIVWKNDDEEAGIIEYVEMTSEEQEIIVVRGRFASSVATRRIVWDTERLRGDVSEAVGWLLERHMFSPENPDRAIAGFEYSAPNLGHDVNALVSHRNLLSVIESQCDLAGVGFKTVWNSASGVFTFTLYRAGASHAVFSKEYENLNAQTFQQSELEYANLAFVAGEGEGADRQTLVLGESTGEERREVFIDAKDLRAEDFGTDYPAALAQRGHERLSELERILAFDAEINPHGNLRYKTDFDIGQIVRVSSDDWRVALTTRITEIEESYDRDGQTLQIVFGRGLLTLSQKLKVGI